MEHATTDVPPARGTLRVWRIAAPAALVLSVYDVLRGWLIDVQDARGRFVAPSRATLAAASVGWLAWALLTPAVVTFFRRVPAERSHAWRTFARYAAGAVAFALVHGLLAEPAFLAAIGAPPARNHGPLGGLLRVVWWALLTVPTGVMQFLIFAALYHAAAARRVAGERALAAAHLQEALARAELDALRMRLEPHFLFNTLNAITAYIRARPAEAERMVGGLSRLLRGVLELREEQEIALGTELALLDEYLDIQRLRFGERLETCIEVDAHAANALVPTLLLQPLVENAVDHGVARRRGAGRVAVAASRDGDVLRLEIVEWGAEEARPRPDAASAAVVPIDDTLDAGPGQHPRRRRRTGVGLATTKTRLQQLYGAAHALTLVRAGNGSRVEVRIPYRPAPR